jgi:hypothetical protein
MKVAFQHSIGWDLRYLIARVTGRPVHVATVYDDDLFEAAWSGMRRLKASSRLADGDWEIFDVPLQYDTTRARALASMRTQAGMKYDWRGAVYAWWLGRSAGRGDANRVFCSEEAGDELLSMKLPLRYRRTAHYTPRQLRDELRQVHGWTSYRLKNGERMSTQ